MRDPYTTAGVNRQQIRAPRFLDEDDEPLAWSDLSLEQRDAIERSRTARYQARAQALWRRAVDVTGTRAELFLRSRGVPPPYSGALRYHPALWCASMQCRLPALLAALAPIGGNEVEAVATIWLDPHATGSLRLYSRLVGHSERGVVTFDALTSEIVVGRRIDTTLAAAGVLGLPAVATMSAMRLERLQLPDAVTSVIIALDLHARSTIAEALISRLSAAGVAARIVRPPDAHERWTAAALERLNA